MKPLWKNLLQRIRRSTKRSTTRVIKRCRPAVECLEDRTLLTVQFTVDPLQDVQPISRYIYGINQVLPGYSNYTMQRLGGNLTTDWNWVTSNTNAGSDFYFQNQSFSYFAGGVGQTTL